MNHTLSAVEAPRIAYSCEIIEKNGDSSKSPQIVIRLFLDEKTAINHFLKQKAPRRAKVMPYHLTETVFTVYQGSNEIGILAIQNPNHVQRI